MTHDDFIGLFRDPIPGRVDYAYVEAGEYIDGQYEIDSAHAIRIGPDGYAYVCIGHESDIPELPDPAQPS